MFEASRILHLIFRKLCGHKGKICFAGNEMYVSSTVQLLKFLSSRSLENGLWSIDGRWCGVGMLMQGAS